MSWQIALAVPVATFAAVTLARASLARVAPEARPPGAAGLAVSAGIGALAAALAGGGDPALCTAVAFAALSLAGAHLDRATAWAPHLLTLPWTVLLLLLSDAPILDGVGAPWRAALGIALHLAAQAAWVVQDRVGRRLITPPDLLILLSPVVLFGISDASLGVLLAVAVVLGLLQRAPARLLARLAGAAAAEAAAETFEARGRAVPLLAVVLPLLVAALCLRLAAGA